MSFEIDKWYDVEKDGVLSDFIDDNCTVLETCAGRGCY
jgi:hypothetical protein